MDGKLRERCARRVGSCTFICVVFATSSALAQSDPSGSVPPHANETEVKSPDVDRGMHEKAGDGVCCLAGVIIEAPCYWVAW